MEAFLTPKQLKRRLDAYERRRNPAPGRTSEQSRRIRTALDSLKQELHKWLVTTEFRPMKGWLPFEHVVTARDDDYLRDYYAAYTEDSETDDEGYLIHFHDEGQKATNRIAAVTWYKNATAGEFLLVKNLYSPLPCEEWGRLPLNLHQWRIIAPQLIVSTQLWQWVHAVRHYLRDDTFEIGGFMGWHLQECAKAVDKDDLRNGPGYLFESEAETEREGQEWTGRIICKHAITEFSLNENGTSDTPCPQ